jgi:hypothetical protein
MSGKADQTRKGVQIQAEAAVMAGLQAKMTMPILGQVEKRGERVVGHREAMLS